ncbi:hypothetical protein P9112_000275 [Eukaryota sp. TZLM1-RC]
MSDDGGPLNDFDHYLMVVSSFNRYSIFLSQVLKFYQQDFESLPQSHRDLIPEYAEKLNKLSQCYILNGEFLSTVSKAPPFFQVATEITPEVRRKFQLALNGELIFQADQHDKVNATLKCLFREWSIEGKTERDQSFQPLIDALCRHFSSTPEERYNQDIKILVPGCGLGRLVWELCRKGFVTTGIEFSFYMILMSGFVLNRCEENQFSIYPFIHSLSNVKCNKDILSPVNIPDVDPSSFPMLPGPPKMQIGAADFVDAFKDDEEFDGIATCWFLDTATNVIEYIEIIHKILKKDGLWVNIGPLTYHWTRETSSAGFVSIELSHEEVIKVIERVGFVVSNHRFSRCQYCQNLEGLGRNEYDCFYFEAKKV